MAYPTYAPPGGYGPNPNDPFGVGGYNNYPEPEPEPEPAGPNPGFNPGYTGTPTPGYEEPGGGLGGTGGALGGGGGGFQMPPWLQQLLSGKGGGLANFLPAMASAYTQWKDADKYGRVGREAASMASPVDTETRKRYQQRMEEFYTDPTGFLERNPQFMATKKLGLNALNARNASRGFMGGDGKATIDELEYISTLGSRFLDQEQKNLMQMGGFQFDPANGARMMMEGTKQEIEARNGALRAMGSGAQGLLGGGGGGGSGGGGGPAAQAFAQALRQAGMNPAAIAQTIKSIFPNGGYTLGSDPWGSGGNEPDPDMGWPQGSSSSTVTGGWDEYGSPVDVNQGMDFSNIDWDTFNWDSLSDWSAFNDFDFAGGFGG